MGDTDRISLLSVRLKHSRVNQLTDCSVRIACASKDGDKGGRIEGNVEEDCTADITKVDVSAKMAVIEYTYAAGSRFSISARTWVTVSSPSVNSAGSSDPDNLESAITACTRIGDSLSCIRSSREERSKV